MRYLCQRLLHSQKSQIWLLVIAETRLSTLRSLLPHLSSQTEETWPVLSVQASCLRPCDRVREPQSSLATQEAKFQRHKASKNLWNQLMISLIQMAAILTQCHSLSTDSKSIMAIGAACLTLRSVFNLILTLLAILMFALSKHRMASKRKLPTSELEMFT